nr:reverse transcriptase domain-containing protein [Tanacetum cinerariifolium]
MQQDYSRAGAYEVDQHASGPVLCSLGILSLSSSKLSRDQTSNLTSSTNPTPKGRIHRSSKQKVENANFEEHLPPVAKMTDNRTMAEMLCAPTKGCAKAIVVPLILAVQFEFKHSLINMMTSEQFFGLEKDNPHDHIWAAHRWLEKEPPRSITTWDDLAWERYKDLLRACPHHGFTEFHQLDTFYNALNPADQDSLNAAAGGNLLEKSPQDALTIIENKSKVHNSRSKPIASLVNAYDINSISEIAKLTHAVNQQTSVVTTVMTAMRKQLQATPPPALVKAVEEICVTCEGAHPYYQCLAAGANTFPEFRDNIQGYVSAAASNYNQGNPSYRPQDVANQMRPPSFAQLNIDMVKNKLRNEMKTSIQTSLSNQTNEIKNMMASLLQMNTASTSGSGSLPGNTVANPKGKLKASTTRSGVVTDGPTVPTPPKSATPKEDECVEETYTDPDLAEYTIKVPPPPVQKHKPSFQRNFFCIQGTLLFRISPLLSNKEKLQELANTPLNENCSAVILKKLPEKLGDPGKFLISCGFSELKCNALADLGASINLMPLFVWRKLGLPGLIPKCMTLELANRAICTPDGSARDVFVPVGKFTFPADFVVVDYKSDPRVPLILERPFLRTACALIDVHGEEMILRDGDERFTLNMKHDTASYSNHPHRESANLINIFNVSSEDCLEVLVSNQQTSGNPTFSLHKEITSPKVTHEIHDSEGCNILFEESPDIYSFNDIHPYFDDNPLSGSTTCSSNSLLEEFTNELTLITYPPDYDDNLQFDIEFDVYDDDFLEIESDANNFYDDPFDFKGEKIKESKLLIDELDLPYDFLPYPEYDSFNSQDFSRDDDLPSPDNEDKVFNPGILIQEKSITIITRVAQEKKLAISYASLVFEDFDPPFYEPLIFKDVPKSMKLLPFSSENEEKVFKPGIYTSKKDNPQMDLQDKRVIDSGCSRHITGNMSYLTDYEELDGGYVAFGGNPKGGKITGKGTIKTGNLDFENVYFLRELKFNLFSVS